MVNVSPKKVTMKIKSIKVKKKTIINFRENKNFHEKGI
jgi:hypothetical protein